MLAIARRTRAKNTVQINGTPQEPYNIVEGDRGAGTRENKGQEGYGRREERGRKAGFSKWREPGEKEKNFAILRNISQ